MFHIEVITIVLEGQGGLFLSLELQQKEKRGGADYIPKNIIQ